MLVLRVDSRGFIIRIVGDESFEGYTYSFLVLLDLLPLYFGGLDIDFSRHVLFLIEDSILRLQVLLLFKHVLLNIHGLILLQHLFFVNLASVHAGAIHKVLHLALFLVLVEQALLVFELGHRLAYSQRYVGIVTLVLVFDDSVPDVFQ
jgi:hypothetical protein